MQFTVLVKKRKQRGRSTVAQPSGFLNAAPLKKITTTWHLLCRKVSERVQLGMSSICVKKEKKKKKKKKKKNRESLESLGFTGGRFELPCAPSVIGFRRPSYVKRWYR